MAKYSRLLTLICIFKFVYEISSFSATSLRSVSKRISMVIESPSSVLVIQNSGGGHGEIGYELCKLLRKSNPSLDVLLLQDKCNYDNEPFSSYKDLEEMGVKVFAAELGDDSLNIPQELLNRDINYIVDNLSKGTTIASAFVGLAKKAQTKQYVFISSAGMYKSSGTMPLAESDLLSKSDVRESEIVIQESGIPYTFLRPQYIYGPRASKRYLDYFIGRAYRKLFTPLPLHGEQLVSLTHVEDVCSLIACVLGHSAAENEIFNCVSDRYITYKSLSEQCHKCLGNSADEMNYLYYDPEDFDRWTDSSPVVRFPFRSQSFFASSSKATQKLGWKPTHSILSDLPGEIEAYLQSGRAREPWGMRELRYDLEIVASRDHSFMFTYPFFDDNDINFETRPYDFESAEMYAEPLNQQQTPFQ